jgi:hypothetical protein
MHHQETTKLAQGKKNVCARAKYYDAGRSVAFSSTMLTCIKREEEHNKRNDDTASRSST